MKKEGDERVKEGLLHQAVEGVNQDESNVGRRGTGHHVPGVLDVAGRVGNYELPLRRSEVAVGHVDGDASFAFGFQSVGEQGEVYAFFPALGAGLGNGLILVFEDRLRVVQQAADEGGFTVVYGAGGGKP